MTLNAPARDAESAAERLLHAGRSRAAEEVLNAALVNHADRGELWLLRGLARHAQAHWANALADLERAMTLLPLPTAGTLALGDCYAHTGHDALALVAYRHLLACGPLPAHFYAGLYAGFRRCDRADLALQACRAACEVDPDDHEALFAMAHAMAALCYSAQYIAGVLEEAVKLAPEKTVYRLSLALELTRAARAAEAYSWLAEAPPDVLRQVPCRCAAQRLMTLCAWAGDAERAIVLCGVVNNYGGRDTRPSHRSQGES